MKGSHGSCSHSYCSAARRQENQETGDRDQMSRRDQRNKINVTRNQRETEDQEEESQRTRYSKHRPSAGAGD